MAKEIVAMILAGGRGSRLYALTQKTAKPAVSFGGKYRIVDFPLSNCVNSNIDTVGIATQYQPQKLNEYIGNGQPWDLDRLHGGVHTLPPMSTLYFEVPTKRTAKTAADKAKKPGKKTAAKKTTKAAPAEKPVKKPTRKAKAEPEPAAEEAPKKRGRKPKAAKE